MNKIGEFFKPQQKDAKAQEAQEKKDLLSNSSAKSSSEESMNKS